MATANEIPAMWELAIFGSCFILGLVCYGKFKNRARIVNTGGASSSHAPFSAAQRRPREPRVATGRPLAEEMWRWMMVPSRPTSWSRWSSPCWCCRSNKTAGLRRARGQTRRVRAELLNKACERNSSDKAQRALDFPCAEIK